MSIWLALEMLCLWNPESGLCMDVMGDQGVTVGTGIMLSGCEFERTNSDHVWNFDPQTGLFRNRLSGLCLDVEGQRATHGLPVQIAVCETILANTGLTDQAWQVQPVDGSNGSFVVNKAAPTRCLGTEGYPYMYWHVYLRDCLSENNTGQLWELIDVCQMPGTNAYTRKCIPVCSRTEYVKDFQCFPCPVGKVGQADACVARLCWRDKNHGWHVRLWRWGWGPHRDPMGSNWGSKRCSSALRSVCITFHLRQMETKSCTVKFHAQIKWRWRDDVNSKLRILWTFHQWKTPSRWLASNSSWAYGGGSSLKQSELSNSVGWVPVACCAASSDQFWNIIFVAPISATLP